MEKYTIYINGQIVPVDEYTYRAYKRQEWREKRRRQRHPEQSYDQIVENGIGKKNAEAFGFVEAVEDVLEKQEAIMFLHRAIQRLPDRDRELIQKRFFEGKTQSCVAKEMGMLRRTLSYREKRILQDIKNILEKFYK